MVSPEGIGASLHWNKIKWTNFMQYLHTRLQSITRVISVAGIHSGAVIHHQDQLPNPVRLMTRNTANTYTQILIPPTEVVFDNIIKSPSILFFGFSFGDILLS